MVCVEDVVHHAVVADAQPMEDVVSATDGLHGLAWDASGLADITREALESGADAITVGVTELLELPSRRPREPDLVGGQSRSSSPTVRPLA